MPRYFILAVVLGAFVAPACTCTISTPATSTQSRAAGDFGCAPQSVAVTSLGGDQYRADGCGKSGVYTCTEANSAYTCVPGTVAATPTAAPAGGGILGALPTATAPAPAPLPAPLPTKK
jgi:hypothetical protein